MLSIENPPPDPSSCPPSDLITRLRNGDDENRVSDQVDLHKSNPEKLPKFSIRDYVFSNRSKDIAANWPFSQKNLQQCLDNGVKDLLPPFESLDSVRNGSLKKKKPATTSVDSGDPPKNNDERVRTIRSDNDCVNITPSDCSKPRANKNHSSSHRPSKRKLSNNNALVPSSNEDNLLETMASKECPVCKTFSSPSNTTLNAHIDQCLSVKSPDKSKRTNNNATVKVTKQQRVKPRKMRLVEDVYANSPMSTVKQLDIRNGTDWDLPAQENNEARVEEKRERAVLAINVEETGDEGAVYIDESGTKVRILSKFNDSAKSQVGLEPRPQKISKGGKNKKRHAHKNMTKYLKLAPQSKKICSSKPNAGGSKVFGGGIERQRHVAEEYFENSKAQQQQQQIKPDELGNMRKRVRSKRTGLSKKSKGKRILHLSRYDFRQQHESGPSHVERSFIPETSDSSDFPPSSPENSKKTRNSSNELNIDDQTPHLRKRATGIFSFGTSNTKFHTKQLRKGDCSRENLSPSSNNERIENDYFSTRKKILSVKQPSMHGSKCNFVRKSPVPKKAKVNWTTEPVERDDDRSRRDRVRKIRTKGGIVPREEENLALGSSYYGKIRKKEGSKGGNSAREEETRAMESSYYGNGVKSAEKRVYTTVGSDVMNKQSEPEFPKLTIPSYTRAKTLRSSFYGDNTDPSFIDDDEDEEMFTGNDDDISHNTLDRARQEKYSFTEVDQIPIPGPPGSFLPSPRGGGGGGGGGMSSGNIQENSSLTSNRILQSSEGIRDMVVYKDSSNSPVSATSTVSNSAIGLSLGPNAVQDETGFSAAKHDTTTARAEKINRDESEKGFLAFKGDDVKPCYCFRKEGLSLNDQESQLRRRRAIMNCDLNRRIPGANSNPEEVQYSPPPMKVHESAANPVLRLMGKNLMVVNKEPQPDVPPRGGNSYGDITFRNQMAEQRPFTFGQNRNNVVGRGYDVNMAKSFLSTTAKTLGGVFPSFIGSVDPRDTIWRATYNLEKTRAPPSANPDKEIIVIDDTDTEDSPERLLAPPSYGARQVNPFYNGLPMTQNASFETFSSLGGANSSSSLMASSSSTGHVRSSLYYSPSFT